PARLCRPARPRGRRPRPPRGRVRDRPPTGPDGSESRSRRRRAAPIRGAGGRSLLPGAGAVADGAEFVAGEPVGPVAAGREFAADPVIDLDVGERAPPI